MSDKQSQVKTAYWANMSPCEAKRQAEARSKRMKAYWSNPESRAKRKASLLNLERKFVLSREQRALVMSLGEVEVVPSVVDEVCAGVIQPARGLLVKRSLYEDGCVVADRKFGVVSSCLECPLPRCVLDGGRDRVVYHREYALSHSGRIRESKMLYYRSHREEKRLYSKEYYQSHREEKRLYYKEYWRSHREEKRLYDKEYYRSRRGRSSQ